jgi:dihydroxycyclohexadiene carboxylate dehydrogenase
MMTHTGRLAGKGVVVTGAAQGIGRTVALRAAREGARLALIDRSELVHDVEDEAKASGAEAIAITAGLETFEDAAAALQAALARYGQIDVLINNVGGNIWAKLYEAYEPAQIEAEIRRSLFPTLWCCRAVVPGGGGTIVNVSSIATRGVNRVPYAAAKGGANAITACLAMEYADHGIRVCGVAPGGTEAPPRRIPHNAEPPTEQESRWYQQIVEHHRRNPARLGR